MLIACLLRSRIESEIVFSLVCNFFLIFYFSVCVAILPFTIIQGLFFAAYLELVLCHSRKRW